MKTGDTALPPGNPTYVPDEIFNSITNPVILIRHPALIAPSLWKVQSPVLKLQVEDEDFRALASLLFTRMMFDYFQSIGKRPIVVDAEDLVTKPEDLATALCSALGIDRSGVSLEWDSLPEDHWPHLDQQVKEFAGDLLKSKGIKSSAKKVRTDDSSA